MKQQETALLGLPECCFQGTGVLLLVNQKGENDAST
jgi:hypothetical protein